MVGAFHNEHAQFEPDALVGHYLYGLAQTLGRDDAGNRILTQEKIEHHEFNGKTIPSALFRQVEAANLSGVLFSNQHTITKFNRIGTEQGLGHPDTAFVRFGTFYNSSPDTTEPSHFVYTVGRQPAHYRETFAQGLHLFINPWANIPLDPVLHSEISWKRVTAPAIVADQRSGHVCLTPESAGDRSDRVGGTGQYRRGEQPADRRGRQGQKNQPQPAASLSARHWRAASRGEVPSRPRGCGRRRVSREADGIGVLNLILSNAAPL